MAKKAKSKGKSHDEEIEEVPEVEETPEEVPPEPPADVVPAEAEADGTREPVDPPTAGSHTITIEGEGPLVFHADGEVRRADRGEPFEATDADLATLKELGISFKKGKSK